MVAGAFLWFELNFLFLRSLPNVCHHFFVLFIVKWQCYTFSSKSFIRKFVHSFNWDTNRHLNVFEFWSVFAIVIVSKELPSKCHFISFLTRPDLGLTGLGVLSGPLHLPPKNA